MSCAQAELVDAEVNDPWVQAFVLHMDRIFKWFKVYTLYYSCVYDLCLVCCMP